MDDFDDQIKQTTKNPWYAVRTFNCQELKIGAQSLPSATGKAPATGRTMQENMYRT